MMKKLGGWVSHGMASMGPVDLHASDSWRKARSAMGTENPFALFGLGAMQNWKAGAEFAAHRASNPAIKGYGIADWFKGATYQDKIAMASGPATSTMMKAMQNRALIRGGAVASIVAPMVFGSDSLPGRMAGMARGAAFHATGAAAMSTVSPLAGAMYAGFAGINMIRRGDNWGPF